MTEVVPAEALIVGPDEHLIIRFRSNINAKQFRDVVESFNRSRPELAKRVTFLAVDADLVLVKAET